MTTGSVITFNIDRGFGFIPDDGDTRLFFHVKDAREFVRVESREPVAGDRVSFQIGKDRHGEAAAVEVTTC
jgi:cold shock CspA family protein